MRLKSEIEKEYKDILLVYGQLKYKEFVIETSFKEELAKDQAQLKLLEEKLLALNEEASKLEAPTQPQDDNGV